MKNKNPAYRVTKWLSGLNPHLETWYDHFIELDDPVALVENDIHGIHQYTGEPVVYKRFSIWRIGKEHKSETGSLSRNGNEEVLDGKILKEANGFSVILNSELNNQELDKQREEQSNGKRQEEIDHHKGRTPNQESQGSLDGGGHSDVLETISEGDSESGSSRGESERG